MKIDIVQFTPVPGGESTWTKATALILQDMGHQVRIITPTKSGRKLSGFMEMPNQIFIKEKKICEELQKADIIYFVNSIHLQKSKRKSELQKQEIFDKIKHIFEGIQNKKIIMHEHGNMYSIHLYKYAEIIEILQANNNKIVMTTNLRSSVPKYEEMGIPAFVTRQPFYPAMYPKVEKNKEDSSVISFNSRYTAIKRPQLILAMIEKYLKEGLNFKFRFKGNKNDNVTIWSNLTKYFEYPQISIKKNVPDMYKEVTEIYEDADFCVYPGNSVKSEKGRVEYSMMESWFYELPLMVSTDIMENFNTDEFQWTNEMVFAGMIPMNEENVKKMVNNSFTNEEIQNYINGGKMLLKDFLPEKFIPRLQKALDYFKSDEEREKENFLFPFYESANC
jgi:glycosyltransferase involved in cell wall biosynthesis